MPNGNINGELASHGHITGVLTIGAGGTSDYEMLENKPQINGYELIDNQTAHELGLASMQDVSDIDSDIALLSQKLPKNYSTDEQNTGVKWLDGKYIYQKTYDLSNLIIPDNTWTNNLLETSNINILDCKGYFKLEGQEALFPYSYYRNGNEFFTWNINVSTINVRPNMNAGVRIRAGIITIYYTKNE